MKMVPSDPLKTARSPAGMHGQNSACETRFVAHAIAPSTRCFSRLTSLRPHVKAPYSLEVSGSTRPFARPQRAVSYETSHGGVITPGLHLRLKRIAHEPYGPQQPLVLGLLDRGQSTIATRFRPAATRRFCRLKPSLPVRNCFLPFQRARLHPAKPTYLGDWPDLLSLPEASLSRSASDHRSRSATYRSACCPMNLLEPTPVCLQTPLASIEIEL